MGPKSHVFERDISSDPIQVRAHLLDPICGGVDFSSTSEWVGTVEGASTKVFKCCSRLVILSQNFVWVQAFSVVVTGRNGQLALTRRNTEEPLDKANSGQPRVGCGNAHSLSFI